jgi:lysophospholipase
MAEPAPFFAEAAEGPAGGHAVWLRTADDRRIRAGFWPEGSKGTALLFPGRTEYVEKYGRAAADFAARGYATATVDWRGQGLADRLLPDPMKGHVGHFGDYQHDVAALIDGVRAAGLPAPYHLVAHSMGGAIGLGALHRGLPVDSAVFTGPMWGIAISAFMRPVAWVFSAVTRHLGIGQGYVPGTEPDTYVSVADFEDNALTTDRDMFDYMRRQIDQHPELALGGPTLHWLYEALVETRRLRAQAPPPVPALTFLGTREKIVDPRPVHAVMARWPGGRLDLVEDAEHEVLMETPAIRQRVFDATVAHFDAARVG